MLLQGQASKRSRVDSSTSTSSSGPGLRPQVSTGSLRSSNSGGILRTNTSTGNLHTDHSHGAGVKPTARAASKPITAIWKKQNKIIRFVYKPPDREKPVCSSV